MIAPGQKATVDLTVYVDQASTDYERTHSLALMSALSPKHTPRTHLAHTTHITTRTFNTVKRHSFNSLTYTLYNDTQLSAALLNTGADKIEDILIVHLENGKDYFVSLQGHYLATCFAYPLEVRRVSSCSQSVCLSVVNACISFSVSLTQSVVLSAVSICLCVGHLNIVMCLQ